MANPFNQLNPANPMRGYDFNAIRGMYQSMMSGNPMQMLSQMAMKNPQAARVMNALRMGSNPQQLFQTLCQQKGINPQEFINNMIGNNGQ